MNFDQHYRDFIKRIEDKKNNGSNGPIILSLSEKAAIEFFVAYLNLIYSPEPNKDLTNENKCRNRDRLD